MLHLLILRSKVRFKVRGAGCCFYFAFFFFFLVLFSVGEGVRFVITVATLFISKLHTTKFVRKFNSWVCIAPLTTQKRERNIDIYIDIHV